MLPHKVVVAVHITCMSGVIPILRSMHCSSGHYFNAHPRMNIFEAQHLTCYSGYTAAHRRETYENLPPRRSLEWR